MVELAIHGNVIKKSPVGIVKKESVVPRCERDGRGACMGFTVNYDEMGSKQICSCCSKPFGKSCKKLLNSWILECSILNFADILMFAMILPNTLW